MAVVTFLSDYGLADDFVGVCHGVIARIAPAARVIDVTHGIARHDVRSGALVLRRALQFMPAGVHLAVVDPGVGSSRRAVALRCAGEERFLVGPDNGLLTLAAERFGGVAEAVDIGASPFALAPCSATFHGRDVFAPVAAQLALGVPLARTGSPLDPAGLVVLDLPRARGAPAAALSRTCWRPTGSATRSSGPSARISRRSACARGDAVVVNGLRATYGATFTDAAPGGLVLYLDSYDVPSLAVNRGSAMAELGLEIDACVEIARDA